jgi:hypothetical protein
MGTIEQILQPDEIFLVKQRLERLQTAGQSSSATAHEWRESLYIFGQEKERWTEQQSESRLFWEQWPS